MCVCVCASACASGVALLEEAYGVTAAVPLYLDALVSDLHVRQLRSNRERERGETSHHKVKQKKSCMDRKIRGLIPLL